MASDPTAQHPGPVTSDATLPIGSDFVRHSPIDGTQPQYVTDAVTVSSRGYAASDEYPSPSVTGDGHPSPAPPPSPAPVTDNNLDARPYFGDPCSIVVASEPDTHTFLRRLADLVPDWMADAACAGQPVGIFFPGLGERNTAALELCGRCPVRVQCRDWAITEQINHGVFGGMSPAARRAHGKRKQ